MFEKASRIKLRFETPEGNLYNAEDLWDLPLASRVGRANLDTIALNLHAKLRENADVTSFVEETAGADPTTQLQFDIVKHVIDTRKKEAADTLAAKDRKQARERLQAALERKRDNKLETMSEDEINAELAKLG